MTTTPPNSNNSSRSRSPGLPRILVEPISGLLAGSVATILVHPLDLVKTRIQVDRTKGTPKLGTAWRLAQEALRKGGLYRGLTVNVMGNATGWGLYFFFYGEFKARFLAHKQPTSLDYLLTSAGAGVLSQILTNPLWVMKTRMLSPDERAYPSITAGVKNILATEGLRGFMSGIVPGCFGVMNSALQFMLYERLKEIASRGGSKELNTMDYLMTSATSKIVAGVLTYPYKVVQVRAQNFKSGYNGPRDIVMKIAKEEGLRGFYKGVGLNSIRVLPSTCITFVVYENLKIHLGSV